MYVHERTHFILQRLKRHKLPSKALTCTSWYFYEEILITLRMSSNKLTLFLLLHTHFECCEMAENAQVDVTNRWLPLSLSYSPFTGCENCAKCCTFKIQLSANSSNYLSVRSLAKASSFHDFFHGRLKLQWLWRH